jgi:hypothetical protein
MILTAPMPYKEALDSREVKSILPTTGKTSDFAQLAPEVKERAMFSATVDSGELLQKIDDMVNSILTGQSDQATARAQVSDLLWDMGYNQPDPDKQGGLQDLKSEDRINLQLETNVEAARGYGWWKQGQQADVLDEYPAQELVRFSVPKGGISAERNWADRWTKAGGQFYDGRMIALKNDPVWSRLGDPGLFEDGLGNPYPPFAFNSGMDVQDIDRDEAVDLGLIDEDTEIFPQDRGFNDDLQASPDVRNQQLRDAMEDSGAGHFDQDGTFIFGQDDDGGAQ